MKKGWFGNSQGHALAAKGVRMYAHSKSTEAMFYAMKQEEMVSYADVMSAVRRGCTFDNLKREYPGADPEKLRQRGLKAIEARDADNTLTFIEQNGIDAIMSKANASATFREKMENILGSPQMRSYLKQEKVVALQRRLQA